MKSTLVYHGINDAYKLSRVSIEKTVRLQSNFLSQTDRQTQPTDMQADSAFAISSELIGPTSIDAFGSAQLVSIHFLFTFRMPSRRCLQQSRCFCF